MSVIRKSGALVATVALACAPASAQAPAVLAPSQKNFDKWLTFIRPDQTERAYQRIAWRNRFWPAVAEARKLGRPILLWAMNGHPLGCT